MAGVPGRAQSTSKDMAESGERDRNYDSSGPISESLRSVTEFLKTSGHNWDKKMAYLESQNEELKRELMKERCGHATASERTMRDQQNVEDITDPNRPSQIAQKYTQFVDGERMDAIEKLDTEFPDEKPQNEKFVCQVFQVAFEVATMAINSVRQHLPNILVNPTSLRGTSHEEVSKDERDIKLKYSTKPALRSQTRDAHVRNIMDGAIFHYLKKTSGSIDTTAMEQDVLSELRRNSHGSLTQRKLDKRISLLIASENAYISQCCRMAWQLVVQTPSMHIQYSENVYDPTKHRLQGKKSPASESTRIYYLWPTLLTNLNGKVVYKGIVSAVESRV